MKYLFGTSLSILFVLFSLSACEEKIASIETDTSVSISNEHISVDFMWPGGEYIIKNSNGDTVVIGTPGINEWFFTDDIVKGFNINHEIRDYSDSFGKGKSLLVKMTHGERPDISFSFNLYDDHPFISM